MASYSSRSFITTIAFAVTACVNATTFAISAAVQTMCSAYYFVRDLVVDFIKSAVAKFERPAFRVVDRTVELVQACAYALRIAKRERPQVRDTWRMCPSI